MDAVRARVLLQNSPPFFRIFLVCFLSLSGIHAVATTVLRVDMDYLVENSELIFEGKVLSHTPHWNANKTGIQTEITFRVIEILKGSVDESEVTLNFAGGAVDGINMSVSSMVYPNVGETGVYFVESLSRDLVNPLVGWAQGHYRVLRDDLGEERIVTEGDWPVLGVGYSDTLRPHSRAHVHGSEVRGSNDFSHGVARGVRVGRKGDDLERAMSKREFKQMLMNKSRTGS